LFGSVWLIHVLDAPSMHSMTFWCTWWHVNEG